MRDDIAKLICERQRIGSRNKSIKTGRKFDPTLDYDSGDVDWGPTYVSSARHRQELRCSAIRERGMGKSNSKSLNENLRPLYQYLDKAVGRPWDSVQSDILSRIDVRRVIGYHVMQHVGWHVDTTGRELYRSELFVDDAGILQKNEERHGKAYYRRRRKPERITSLHWCDNVWFKLEALVAPAVCGCVHFKVPANPEHNEKYRRYHYRSNPDPAVCIHGNEAGKRELWYVIEYGYHKPDDVFEVHHYRDGELTRKRYNLNEPGDVHIVYYRDVPKKLEEAFVVRKKVANRKELKLIRKAIVEAAVEAASAK